MRTRFDDGFDLRALRGRLFTEYFLIGSVREAAGSVRRSAQALFARLAEAVAKHGIEPIQEQIFGLRAAKEEVLRARERAFLRRGIDPALPRTYIEGRPVSGSGWAGFQVWGVASSNPRAAAAVATVAGPGGVSGRLWSGRGFKLLYLPAVLGLSRDHGSFRDPARQAERMFLNVRDALKAQGFSYSSVARTWIYLRRILDWYGGFNRVRNSLYGRDDFFGKNGASAFPASTGIQGRCGDEECVMDVLALDGGSRVSVRPILESPLQGRAFSYRSAFSRAMALRLGDVRTVHVSGTASIDSAGASAHRADAMGQSLRTLLSVAALLEEQGTGLENICRATLYCADRAAFEAYRKAVRLLRVPRFPTVAVLADVCRPELLIEMEAVAAVPG